VIVRITSPRAVREHALNAYLEYVLSDEIADYETAAGLISVWLIRRSCVAYVELILCTLQSRRIIRVASVCPTTATTRSRLWQSLAE
jgi:hypothetical protein